MCIIHKTIVLSDLTEKITKSRKQFLRCEYHSTTGNISSQCSLSGEFNYFANEAILQAQSPQIHNKHLPLNVERLCRPYPFVGFGSFIFKFVLIWNSRHYHQLFLGYRNSPIVNFSSVFWQVAFDTQNWVVLC